MNFKNCVRVVWNLTNVCPYNCPFCVASANKRVEESIDKFAILDSILSVDNKLLSIDFSGGDPLAIDEGIAVIRKASKMLGRNKISISSTGLSLSKLSDSDLKTLASGYDITYDFPKKYKSLDIRDERYNEYNYEQAMRIKKLGLDVDIYIPIRNIEDKYYKQLAYDIIELNPNSVKLLKLMPLGQDFKGEKIDTINKSQYLISQLKSLGYSGNIKINCAMKEDFKEKNNCDMLSERKVGLDHYGNLYTCIWAADILEDKEKSPFYLGNLLEKNLVDIFESTRVSKYIYKLQNNRNKCYVLEHFYKINKK